MRSRKTSSGSHSWQVASITTTLSVCYKRNPIQSSHHYVLPYWASTAQSSCSKIYSISTLMTTTLLRRPSFQEWGFQINVLAPLPVESTLIDSTNCCSTRLLTTITKQIVLCHLKSRHLIKSQIAKRQTMLSQLGCPIRDGHTGIKALWLAQELRWCEIWKDYLH